MSNDNNTRSTLVLVLVVVGVILSAIILVVLMRSPDADTTSTPVPTVSEDLSMAPTQAVAAPKKFAAGNSWLNHGGSLSNTRFNNSEHKIGPENVDQLALKWSKILDGDIQATPVVYEGVVYITDRGGTVWAFNEDDGSEIWKNDTLDDHVRNAPAIYKEGNTLIMGDVTSHVLALRMSDGTQAWKVKIKNGTSPYGLPLEGVTQAPTVFQDTVYIGLSSMEESVATQGWYIQYFGCCNWSGSMWALDARDGSVKWSTDMVDGSLKRGVISRPDLQDPETWLLGYSGASVWGSAPAIDLKRRQIYIATGNNYEVQNYADRALVPAGPGVSLNDQYGGNVSECIEGLLPQSDDTWEDRVAAGLTDEELDCMDPKNLVDSIVALDMDTGEVNWSYRVQGFDAFTVGCTSFGTWCPSPDGPDFDFGQAPMLVKYKSADGSMKELVGAGQKSGIFWAVDPDTGQKLWSTAVGPGGSLGGMMWGSASDGERIYVAVSNSSVAPPNAIEYDLFNPAPGSATSTFGGVWSALDPATGTILWQSADPALVNPTGNTGYNEYLMMSHMTWGPLTVANGVVYASSLSRWYADSNHFALDATSGEILWSVPTEGSVNAGPAVVNGKVYWGSGYSLMGIFGESAKTFYVYSLGGV